MNASSIKRVLKLHLFDSLKTVTLFLTIAFSIGFAIVCGIMLTFGSDSYICLGSLLSAMSGAVAVVVVCANTFSVQFPQNVKMNISRKSSFIGASICSFSACILAILLLFIFNIIEYTSLQLLFGSAYDDMEILTKQGEFIPMMSIVFISLAGLAFVLSAVIAKYGRKGILIVYFIFLAVMMIMPKIGTAFHGIIPTVPKLSMLICLAIAILASLLGSLYTFMTIEVQ